LKRLPYLSEMAAAALAEVETIVLAGAAEPVAFFALPGRPTKLSPDGARMFSLTANGGGVERALKALAALLETGDVVAPLPTTPSPPVGGAIDPTALAQCFASHAARQRHRLR
jgi:acetolactate synthase-1/2/3 large subunit